MDCAKARQHLSDLNRGRLAPRTTAEVRAHVAECLTCGATLEIEARIRRIVQTEAPRYSAPPALKARVQALFAEFAFPAEATTEDAGRGTGWGVRQSRWRVLLSGHPWTVGSLAGAVVVLLVVWAGWLWLVRDPVSLLADRALAEHTEYVKDTMTRSPADASAEIRQVQSQVDFPLGSVYPGDSQFQLVAGKVERLRGRQTAMFIYRNSSGRYTTLFLMPEDGIVIPDEGRLPIETFKPYHTETKGHQLLLWKQRNLACLLVSDLNQAGIASMFLKVRETT
jgi:anti-sigma factor (TIGR02949 family)